MTVTVSQCAGQLHRSTVNAVALQQAVTSGAAAGLTGCTAYHATSSAFGAALLACCWLSAQGQKQDPELHDTKLAIVMSSVVLVKPHGVLQAVGATAGAYLVQHLEPHNLQFAIATSLLVVFILMVCPLAKLLSHLKAVHTRKEGMKEPLLPHQDTEGRPTCSSSFCASIIVRAVDGSEHTAWRRLWPVTCPRFLRYAKAAETCLAF